MANDISRLIYTAGACPLDDSGAIVPVGDIAGQAALAMANLAALAHRQKDERGRRRRVVR